jgi:hypothetical protein
MSKIKDLTGQVFTNLTVIKFAGQNEAKEALWECQCICGNTKVVRGSKLRFGEVKSCGCYKAPDKHGHCHKGKQTRTHSKWNAMLNRCNNPNMKFYDKYGGRGIKVCERWHDFRNFLEDMGEAPMGMTLDRIDNDKGYFKENCRWATMKEQGRNRTNNILVTYNGKTQCLAAWGEEMGIPRSTINTRLKRGWDTIKAITTPTRTYKGGK